MGSDKDSPAVYWVVGNGSEAGKTTVAAAFIRELNAQGQRTIGFKPYSSMRLQVAVDMMVERYPASQCKLFGNDAWELAEASPLTDVDMADLIVPVQILCHPGWRSVVLMRTGSAALGNVEYFTNALGAKLRQRADIRELIAKTGLGFDAAAQRDSLEVADAPRLSPEKPALAYQRLLQLGVDAVVVEGAGDWLPIWRGGPAANHLVLLASGEITFVPDIDLRVEQDPVAGLPGVGALNGAARHRKPAKFSAPLYLAERRRRDVMLQETARKFLDQARRLRQSAG